MPSPAIREAERAPIPDLSLPSVRADLTSAAVDAFIRLMDFWRLTAHQANSLLGEDSKAPWFRMKSDEWEGALSEDALTRISALIGIYKGLHLLFSDPLADEWIRLPNAEFPFNGRAPVDHMISGGIDSMLETRSYIDALRGGL
jgi:hypothetical protein